MKLFFSACSAIVATGLHGWHVFTQDTEELCHPEEF